MKILKIQNCQSCPKCELTISVGNYISWAKCRNLDKKVDPNTIDPDCPLEDAEPVVDEDAEKCPYCNRNTEVNTFTGKCMWCGGKRTSYLKNQLKNPHPPAR